MTIKVKQAALYVRVSTDGQTIENQTRELCQIVERRGWQVVETYSDAGISGSKGRDKRPSLNRMLNDARLRRWLRPDAVTPGTLLGVLILTHTRTRWPPERGGLAGVGT